MILDYANLYGIILCNKDEIHRVYIKARPYQSTPPNSPDCIDKMDLVFLAHGISYFLIGWNIHQLRMQHFVFLAFSSTSHMVVMDQVLSQMMIFNLGKKSQ